MGIRIPVEVIPGTDSGQVITALRKAADRNNRVRSSPSPKAFMTGFTRQGLAFELRVWVNSFNEVPWAKNELCRAIQSELERSGIKLAIAMTAADAAAESKAPRSRSRSESSSRSSETRTPRRRSEQESNASELTAAIPTPAAPTESMSEHKSAAAKPSPSRPAEFVSPDAEKTPAVKTQPVPIPEVESEPELFDAEPNGEPSEETVVLREDPAPEANDPSDGTSATETESPSFGRSKRKVARK